MKDSNCDLCNMVPVKTGKDRLLHQSGLYYIVENGNNDGYAKRISLTRIEHKVPNHNEECSLVAVLRGYVMGYLHIRPDSFFIKKTMRTYPDHFHIHAYVFPEREETQPEEIEAARYLMRI